MNKKEKVKRYFDKVVITNYFDKEKITKQALKAAAKTLNIFYSEAKTEYRKAYVRLAVRINYLWKSNKVTLLNYRTGITKDVLINLVLKGNISLSKKGVNDVIALYESIIKTNKFNESISNAVKSSDNKEIDNDNDNEYNISIEYFLQTLKQQINTVSNGNINAMITNGAVFFSNNAIYRAIKEYYKIIGFEDIGSISSKKAKEQTLWLINEFRALDMLFYKINKGFYSNTAIIKFEDGRSQKVYGIFLKIEKLNIDIINTQFPPLPDKFKKVIDINIDKNKKKFNFHQ